MTICEYQQHYCGKLSSHFLHQRLIASLVVSLSGWDAEEIVHMLFLHSYCERADYTTTFSSFSAVPLNRWDRMAISSRTKIVMTVTKYNNISLNE